MFRTYYFLSILLIGGALYANKPPEAAAVQQIWDSFRELKTQEAELFLEKRHLTEEIANFKKNIKDLSLIKEEKEENIIKKRREIEKKLPLLVQLGRVNPLRLLVDATIGKETLRGMILARTFSTSLKHQLLEMQAELDKAVDLSKELNEKTKSYVQLIQGLEFQQAHLNALQKKLISYMEKSELERLKGEDDVNTLLDESRLTLSSKGRGAAVVSVDMELPFRWLERPVRGKILQDPELQEKFSLNGQGIIFETKKNAEVLSPSEGVIVFKGPFKSQGDILIIDHGEKVHTVFMGMHKIDAEIGQNVYAGQKIGTMAGHGISPKLYLELRKDGKAIDPHPYFIE